MTHSSGNCGDTAYDVWYGNWKHNLGDPMRLCGNHGIRL